MYKKVSIVILLMPLLASCVGAKTVWIKQGVSTSEAQREFAQCEYEASAATQSIDYGYKSIFGQSLDQAMRKSELMKKCLAARGFAPQTVQTTK